MWMGLMVGLDDDQSIVTPEIYENKKYLYDKICGVGYLLKVEDGLDWVWEQGLERAIESGAQLLEKVYVVRVRLPWNVTEGEWWIDQEELNENRDEYEILEIQIRGTPKNKPHEDKLLDKKEFEMNREAWIVKSVRYLVCWKYD